MVGTSCSGKTTLARALASRLRSQHIELDALHWGPNWTPTNTVEFRARVARAVEASRWVCCGNYGSLGDLVLGRATAVIWLRYPFRIVLARALRRTIRRIITRERLYAGNCETFRKAFLSKDSILLWVVTSHRRRYRRLRVLFDGTDYGHLRRIELRTPAETRAFLARLQS